MELKLQCEKQDTRQEADTVSMVTDKEKTQKARQGRQGDLGNSGDTSSGTWWEVKAQQIM